MPSITQTVRKTNLIKSRLLLEKKRNALFEIDNDIKTLLNTEHVDFLIDDRENEHKINYYYRRRELSYTECISNFEVLKGTIYALQVDFNYMLSVDTETEDYHIYMELFNLIMFIQEETEMMIKLNGNAVKKQIVEEIKSKIESEEKILEEIKYNLLSHIYEDELEQDMITKLENIIKVIDKRLVKLNNIDHDIIIDLVLSLDKERKKINKFILKPLSLAIKTIITIFPAILQITIIEIVELLTETIRLLKIVVYQRNPNGIKQQKDFLESINNRFKDTNYINEYSDRFTAIREQLTEFVFDLTTDSKNLSDNKKDQCKALFAHFKDKALIEKCEKYNTVLTDKKEVENNADLLKKGFKYEFDNITLINNQTAIPAIFNYVGNSIASLFGRYLSFDENMRFNDLDNYFLINYILIRKADGSLEEIKQSGLDAGGLRRDFITALTTELFEKKIFISRDGTKKYFLNQEFKPDEEFVFVVNAIIGENVYQDKIFNKFYKFIGLLLSFILVNECGIEHTLSLSIMAQFIHTTPLEPLDYIYCLLDDFPEFSKSLFKLLENRSTIEHAYMVYNDIFDLYIPKIGEEPDKDVDGDNIDDYIEKLAIFMMSKTILRKGIEIKKEKGETDEQLNRRYKRVVYKGQNAYSAMIEGMSMNVKTKLTTSEIPIHTITSYMTAGNMSKEIIAELKANFIKSMETSINTHSTTSDHYSHLKTMRDLFISNVLTKPTGMTEINYFDFMTKLLRFWSGSTFFKKNQRYKIEVNSASSLEHLPQSHTCYFTIDIPLYTSGTVLFEKLEKAVNYIEEGIGLQGGGKKRKILKKLKKVN